MKTVCIAVGSRANYASIKSVMMAIKADTGLNLKILLYASAVLDRFGRVSDIIRSDGFSVDVELHTSIEGEDLKCMSQSTGLGLMKISDALEDLDPDFVLTVGDRFETMAVTLATAYQNRILIHTMGGEVTGTIDESIRHATTKFAHIHFVASEDAYHRVLRLGEDKSNIFNVGCPRIDEVKRILESNCKLESFNKDHGVGDDIDLNEPFLLVSQHSVTTEYGDSTVHIRSTLEAIKHLGMPAVLLWPNEDGGSSAISREIRKLREVGTDFPLRVIKNLPMDIYISLMAQTSCLIGNSSSGIREGAFIGTPVVNIGSRQNMRERGKNVIDVENKTPAIIQAIEKQIKHGPYKSVPIYGDGNTGRKIVEILGSVEPVLQKTISY